MDKSEKSIERIRKCRIQLEQKNPFFSYLALHLKLVEFTKEEEETLKGLNKVPTMAVDKEAHLYYSPDFIETLSDECLKTIICHECLHLALHHVTRGRKQREESWDGWGISVDAVTNNILLQNNFSFDGISEGAIIPENDTLKFGSPPKQIVIKDISKKTAEQIYEELMSQARKKKMIKNIPMYSPTTDLHDKHSEGKEEGEGKGKSDKDIEKEWKRRLITASEHSKNRGNQPAGIGRYVDELLENKLNWKNILQRQIVNEVVSDFTWMKQSKKSIASGFYMPSVKKENVNIVCFVDVSGSISQDELKEFITEIYNISRYFESLKIQIIFWDTQMNNHFTLNQSTIKDILDYKFQGGGGTTFDKCYEWTDENIPNTKLIVFFTDGYASFPKAEDIKTIWILTKEGCKEDDIPYGQIIKLEK